jgi:hypothetical protein
MAEIEEPLEPKRLPEIAINGLDASSVRRIVFKQ